MKKYNPLILALCALSVFPSTLVGITTTHHDKPEDARIPKMVNQMQMPLNTTNIERQKRLLPYINYYINDNNNDYQKTTTTYRTVSQPRNVPTRAYLQHNEKFTPFLDSNALPGPFIPIIKNEANKEIEKNLDYSQIYDTLMQLKQNRRPLILPQVINYIPKYYYNMQPTKTVINTYTPTNIDIATEEKKNYENTPVYKIYQPKPQVTQHYQAESPQLNYRPYAEQDYVEDKSKNEQPIIYFHQTTKKPATVNTIIDNKFVAQKFTQSLEYEDEPIQITTEQKYVDNDDYYTTQSPNVIIPTENTNALSKILKQLQNSNTLPQTLTAENIDNSIKTLIKILNSLKERQKLIINKPIVVEEDDGNLDYEDHNTKYAPGTVTQTFPANTVNGGTPGRPGIDYPALSSIPKTDFNCKTQRYKGFFGDPHTNCQVWHYCDLNGGQASFLCPNGTIFSQVALTCDWWYNVKCSSTAQLYVLNERLYKYIIPLAPKFPEDYSGPLVDKYLALKFKEMEEKMKKSGKPEKSEEKDDSDQLQDIQNAKAKSSQEK